MLEACVCFETEMINPLIDLVIKAGEVLVVDFSLTIKLVLSIFNLLKASFGPRRAIYVLLEESEPVLQVSDLVDQLGLELVLEVLLGVCDRSD